MDRDRQEALSRQWNGYWVLPLSSGRIAVWDHPMAELKGIFNRWEEVTALPPRLERAQNTTQLTLSLKDLDL